jgi:hypothetical protein
MSFTHPATLILTVFLLMPTASFALDASDFSGLEGWTVAAVTQVRDEFEGCDFDRRIRFTNGWVLTCGTYSYSYSYMPNAAIFVKSLKYQNRAYWSVKVLIDDEFYDMLPIPAK